MGADIFQRPFYTFLASLRQAGTLHTSKGSRSTVFEHMFFVLNLSGIIIKNPGLMPTTLSHIPWVRGTYFSIGLITCRIKKLIILFKSLGQPRSNFMVLRFHNPHPQPHRPNLRCLLYVQQLKQAQDNHQTYTEKDNINSPFGL